MFKTLTTKQKQMNRDRATVRAEVKVLKNPESTQADRKQAIETITTTVMKGTGLTAIVTKTEDTPTMLANLTAALVDSVSVDLGIEGAIKLKCSPEDAASIPQKVKDRLKQLSI